MTNAAVFEGAARAFLALLDAIRARDALDPGQWERPALGVWTVRDLAGHTSRAIVTVSDYLSLEAPERVTCPDAETYLLGLGGGAADHAAIAARGVEAGAALGNDPAATLARTLDRTLAAIAVQPTSRIVSVVGGRAIPLAEYLRTRVFELVVHSIDLARATNLTVNLPERATEDAAALAARVAVRGGCGESLLLAMTGRKALPEGFTVL